MRPGQILAVVHVGPGVMAGGGLGVDVGDVAGVFDVQRYGDAQEASTLRRERLTQWGQDAGQFGHRARRDLGPVLGGRRVARVRTGAMPGAIASRARDLGLLNG